MMADWICLRFGIAKAQASEMIAVGHALEDLPLLARTYEAGLLSWDKLLLAVELADTDSDAEVAADARTYSLHDLRRLERQKRIISSQEAAEVHRGRSFRWWWEGDSWVAFGGRLPADQGATVIKALARVADHAAPGPDGIYEAFECRAADALADICGVKIADDADPDKATVIVHIDADVLAGAEGVAELEDGGFVAAEIGHRLACGGRIQLVSHGPNGEILGQGRMSRLPSAWLRRHVKRRDRWCVFPGCGRTRFLRPHHLEHWTKGGPTDVDNLGMLCSAPHSLVHEGGWTTRGRPSTGLVFIRPDGTELEGPKRLRPEIRDRVLSAM